MERVTFNLHSQVCTMALEKTTNRLRNLAENTLLLVAVCGFGVLVISHLSFVHRQNAATHHGYWGGHRTPKSIPRMCLPSIPGFRREADLTHIIITSNERSFANVYTGDDALNETGKEETCSTSGMTMAPTCSALTVNETFSMSYSKTKGFLLLSPKVCSKHNVSTQFVHVARTDARCFGEPFLQAMVFHVLGPETVVLNWLLAVHDGQGYIYNRRTKNMFDLNDYASPLWGRAQGVNEHYQYQLVFKLGVILTSLFLFFITTTLVSFTLRETQDRMLAFTFQLQAHVQSQRPLAQLVFTHVVENLVFVPVMVGMMFFLIEFYGGDKFLAFMVLSIVWVCEVFSIVSMRTTQGMQFFPKIFFLLFTAFHIYFFSCPFGFSYTALASTVCFMIHSMLFFWHRYELPAVARGLVTLEQPRMRVISPDGSSESLPVMPEEFDEAAAGTPILAPRIQGLARHQSHERSYTSMSTLGRTGLPRLPSSNGLFHNEDEDDDDDDGDGSYMYFMNGEIVMHRDRHASVRTPSPMTQGASVGESLHSHGGLPVVESENVNTYATADGIPRRIMTTSASPPTYQSPGPTSSASFESVSDVNQTDGRRALVDTARSPSRPLPAQAQEPLHADATPRLDNLSDPVEDPTVASAPQFPFPLFGD